MRRILVLAALVVVPGVRELGVPVGAPRREFTAGEVEEVQRKHGMRRKVTETP